MLYEVFDLSVEFTLNKAKFTASSTDDNLGTRSAKSMSLDQHSPFCKYPPKGYAEGSNNDGDIPVEGEHFYGSDFDSVNLDVDSGGEFRCVG